MSETKSTTAEVDGVRTLAKAIRGDHEEDYRACRQKNCHGELQVTDDGTV